VTKSIAEQRKGNMASNRAMDVQAELRFWDRALGEIDERPDLEHRHDPNKWEALLPNLIKNLLPRYPITSGETPTIIDVGCGPLSSLAGVQMEMMTLIGIDPLRNEFAKILRKYSLVDNCLMLQAGAEDTEQLRVFANTGDLVWMCNALDHTIDPFKTFENLKMMTKPGGDLLISTHENEADRGNMHGMHKINIFEKDDQLWCSVRDEVAQELPTNGFHVMDITSTMRKEFGQRNIVAHYRKLQPLEAK